MTKIYRTDEFSLTQAAVEHMRFLQNEYLRQSPDDPPVLAGIFTAYPMDADGLSGRQLGIGFWRRSEVSKQAWDEEKIVDVAGFKVRFSIPNIDRLIFRSGVIDHSPEHGFMLRSTVAG